MIGTFIFNSSSPNDSASRKHRNSSFNGKKQIQTSENNDKIPNQEVKNDQNQKKKAKIQMNKKLNPAPISQSSCPLANDISDFSQYAIKAANTDSSINSCLSQSSLNSVHQNNFAKSDLNISFESVYVENAKLKTKLEEMGEREDGLRFLAEENEKLRRAHIKLNLELEKYKASQSPLPQYQNYSIARQLQELKDENKNKAKLIAQLGKQQEMLSNENAKLKEKVLEQKELFNKLTISSNQLIIENERLQALFQEQKRKSHQKKEEIHTLMFKLEQNDPSSNFKTLQSLNDQVSMLEKSFNDIQVKNERLLKENSQLKEQISLYQQIDSKMQTESQQLKDKIIELMNNQSKIVDQNNFDRSQYIPKQAYEELQASFLEVQHQVGKLQTYSNNLQQNLASKETQCNELLKEKENLSELLNRAKSQVDEMKLNNEKIENQFKVTKEEMNKLKQKSVENEQILYENSRLREKNLSLSKKLSEYSSSEKLELENNMLKQENTKLKEALDQASQISEIKDLVYENGYGYEKDSSILTNENEELKNELEDARNRLSSIMSVLKKCSIEKVIPEM